MLLAEINNLIEDPWIIASRRNEPKRTTRGLIDEPGKIFQDIIGTDMDSDVKYVRREIQVLSDKDEG